MIGAFANGLLLTFLPAILYPLLGSLGYAGTTFSDADFASLGIILGVAGKIVNPTVITAVVVLIILGLVAQNYLVKKEK